MPSLALSHIELQRLRFVMPPNPYLKAIAGTATSAKASPKEKVKKEKGKGKEQFEGSTLHRDEILALGGDEEDYKMLQGVESESEFEEEDEEAEETGDLDSSSKKGSKVSNMS